MRTTITLDPDVEALIKAAMVEQHLTFKDAVNRAIRAGLAPPSREPFRQRTFDLGFRPEIPYDKALQLAAAVEDQELARKMALGK
ncbi:MAG TPA: antitoxin [Actinomycetota bacterium]|nr:antitoxin [Actinomycetota bacterium]